MIYSLFLLLTFITPQTVLASAVETCYPKWYWPFLTSLDYSDSAVVHLLYPVLGQKNFIIIGFSVLLLAIVTLILWLTVRQHRPSIGKALATISSVAGLVFLTALMLFILLEVAQSNRCSEDPRLERIEYTSDVGAWREFQADNINLRFLYPPESHITEDSERYSEYRAEEPKGEIREGDIVSFFDGQQIIPSIEVRTAHYDAAPTRYQGLGVTDFGIKKPFFRDQLMSLPEKHPYISVQEVEPGMFWLVGYPPFLRCGRSIMSYLFVKQPILDQIDVITFDLGTPDAFIFDTQDFLDDCHIKPDAIEKKMSYIINRHDINIKKRLDLAIQIAKTFK